MRCARCSKRPCKFPDNAFRFVTNRHINQARWWYASSLLDIQVASRLRDALYFTGRNALLYNVPHTHKNRDRALHLDEAAAVSAQSARRNKVIAIVISVLLHFFALWLIVRHRPAPPLALRGDGDTVTTLLILPDSQAQSPAITTPPVAVPPRRTKAQSIPRSRAAAPPATRKTAQNRPTLPPPLIALDKSLPMAKPAEPQESPPADDFSARLAARQQQRALQESEEKTHQDARGTPEQQANERGKQIALANIASQLRSAGLEKDDAGGLFQLQHVGPHHAEFLFRGWKKEARRNWSQQLDVEQGTESDIRIAVVKKMIDIIRQHTQSDFTWDSHRLGRQIHLSARPEDSVGLQQFLLREFFPDFSTAG